MSTTEEQIIEGRDEALLHLGLIPELWDESSHERRRQRLRHACITRTDLAAVQTVAEAEAVLAIPVRALGWQVFWITFNLSFRPARQTDCVRSA